MLGVPDANQERIQEGRSQHLLPSFSPSPGDMEKKDKIYANLIN